MREKIGGRLHRQLFCTLFLFIWNPCMSVVIFMLLISGSNVSMKRSVDKRHPWRMLIGSDRVLFTLILALGCWCKAPIQFSILFPRPIYVQVVNM